MQLKLQKVIPIIFILLSSNTFAGTFGPGLSRNHFYAGAMLGIASLMDKENTNVPLYDRHYLSTIGATGGGLIGYNFYLCNQWNLGLEGFINATSLNIADNQNYAPQASYTVNMRYNAGVRILPGYELTPGTIVHLILGYANGNFKINDNGNYGIISKQFSKNGFQSGLGIETFLSTHLSLRTDMYYTIYSSQTSYGVTTATPPTTQTYQNRFSTLEGNLSLVYNV